MDIIDLTAEREKRNGRVIKGPWMFSLDVNQRLDGQRFTGLITSFNEEDGRTKGERLRDFAEALEDLAKVLRDQAHAVEPDDDGLVLGVVTVWESSRVRAWISENIKTPEQVEWMCERFDDAKGLAAPPIPVERQTEKMLAALKAEMGVATNVEVLKLILERHLNEAVDLISPTIPNPQGERE